MINLGCRSVFTLLNSTLRIKDIVRIAKSNNQNAVALCDKDVMYGAMAFYRACKEEHIKAIYGLEVSAKMDDNSYNFVLYAKNNDGFKELLKLSTLVCSYENDLDINDLSSIKNCVIALISNEEMMYEVIKDKNENRIGEVLYNLKQYINKLSVAITNNDAGLLREYNTIVKKVAKKMSITTFALSRTFYENENDEDLYRILCGIDQQKTYDDKNLLFARNRYFRNDESIKAVYDEDDIKMSNMIASACNVDLNISKAQLPVFENKFNVDSCTYLRELCIAGLKKRLNNHADNKYLERLEYELEIINKMGFADYFLIVYDFIRYARSENIYVGPGRGSAAGSMVAYCLGITQIDPIKYNLLFERFLNPERISMPDIDVDFPDNKREQVIKYVNNKYHDKHVAHIVTFGTLGAKQVIRDAGRVLKYNLSDIAQLTRLIPNAPKMTLKFAYENSPNFRNAIDSKKSNRKLYDICLRLEGLPRHASIHAAGIVIAKDKIDEICPLIKLDDDLYSTQYTMEYLEE